MKELFESTKVNKMLIRSRIIRSALWMCMADKDGHLTDKLIRVYEELSKGKPGLIITGYAMVDANDRPNPGMMGIYHDDFIPEHKRMVERVHQNNTPIALQLAYGGTQSFHPDFMGKNNTLWGPSSVMNRVTKMMPKAMAKEDIQSLIQHFVDGALRAKEAGYDAVQIHAAHGYLLSQFLSPYCNRRNDKYGGNINNRARILIELIIAMRQALGKDYPILIKMNHDDYMDEGEGMTVDEAIVVAQMLEGAGVDLIEISGTNETSGKGVGPARTRINKAELQSYYLQPTIRIADAVNIPVVLMGGNRDAKRLKEIAKTTSISYFSVARPLLCEPDLVKKWEADINNKPKCISCNACYTRGEVSCIFHRKKK